ncbi:MAG TPA: DinB family protein [Vicinamibacterales bacterium]|nr:DinB family protein [Vicinamibacterales bacterium]
MATVWSQTEQIARHIERTLTGPMWHGPSLSEAVAGVSHAQAVARPVAAAHSIWEIALHAAAWAEIARARLDGRATADPPHDVDWPPILEVDAASWDDAVERLRESYRALATRVRALDEAVLHTNVPGLEYSRWVLLHGVVEHGVYHAGQIALLKRA